jgi:hypothetical protein
VRFEIIVLETGTDRPIPEARVLVIKQEAHPGFQAVLSE